MKKEWWSRKCNNKNEEKRREWDKKERNWEKKYDEKGREG